MIVKAWTLAACVVALAALAGCKTNDDPAKGGFISGLSNLADGTYEKRQQDRRETLENEQDTNLQKQRELERTDAQKAAVSADRAAAEQRYAALSTEIAGLKARLAKAKGQHADLQRQADVLQAKIDMLKADSFTPDAEKAARLEALRKEKAALEDQIDIVVGK